MLKDKRGLSEVITTVIIILIAIAAVAILGVLIKNFVTSGSKGVNLGTKCLEIDARATSLKCNNSANPATCNVTLTRGSGGGDIGGVKLVFNNNIGGKTRDVITQPTTSFDPLDTSQHDDVNTGIPGNITGVEVTVYLDDEGKEYLCETSNTFNI